VFLGNEVFIHKDLESLTSDQVKPLLASSLIRLKKSGKRARTGGIAIVCLFFSILVASFIFLPQVLPQRVPVSRCIGCATTYAPLGDVIALFVEPVLLFIAGIFLIVTYSRHITYKADRKAAIIVGRSALLASLNAILASVPEPPATSRLAADQATRRSLKSVRARIRVLESTPE
jgi:Zn-dependent protease with chaperone function